MRILALFLVLGLTTGLACTRKTVDLDGLPCQNGRCVDGWVCHPVEHVCVLERQWHGDSWFGDSRSDGLGDTRDAGDTYDPCADGSQGGDETDVDCGGGVCPPCNDGRACRAPTDCTSSWCELSTCIQRPRTCSDIQAALPAAEDGDYEVDPDGAAGPGAPFTVNCDMTQGGWTLVGFEPSGAGGYRVEGTLLYLGVEVGDPDTLVDASGPALIGLRFNGLHSGVRIGWGNEQIRFDVSEDLFVNSTATAIEITNFYTSNPDLQGWVTSAGGAVFCRASQSTDVRPGDTSWAVKPAGDTNTGCGCNSGAWAGRGAYYGGALNQTSCLEWGGAWAGVKNDGQQKGGLSSNADLRIWIR